MNEDQRKLHLSDGEIRASQDHELPEYRQALAEAHLAECTTCQERATALRARSQRVHASFSHLPNFPADRLLSPEAARARLEDRLTIRKERQFMLSKSSLRLPRAAWFALAVILILAVSLTFEPVRALANSFLALFRVEQIRLVQVDSEKLEEKLASSSQLEYVLSNNIEVEEKGQAQEVTSAEQASALAGYPLRLPVGLEGEQSFLVQPGASLRFTIDLELVRGVLRDLGRQDIQLPDSLDGALVEMEIPTSVVAAYGECDQEPDPRQIEPETPRPIKPELPQCTTLVQVPSPEVSAPPELDLSQIGEAYLQVLGMSAEQAASFARTVDWTTTFVVPIPDYYAEYEEVIVDGVPGSLIYSPYRYNEPYTLLWVKNGMIYTLIGSGDPSEALEIAALIR